MDAHGRARDAGRRPAGRSPARARRSPTTRTGCGPARRSTGGSGRRSTARGSRPARRGRACSTSSRGSELLAWTGSSRCACAGAYPDTGIGMTELFRSPMSDSRSSRPTGRSVSCGRGNAAGDESIDLARHPRRPRRHGPRPDASRSPTDAIIRVTSTGLCGSDLHLYEVLGAVHRRGRHPRPRADGHRRGGRRRGHRHRARRPRRRPVQHLLRALLDVRPRPAVAVRDDAGPRAGHRRRAVRLHEALRPGARRPGRVPARAAGALRADQGARGPARRPLPFLSDVLPTAWQAVEYADVPDGGSARSCSGSARSARWRAGSPSTAAPSR